MISIKKIEEVKVGLLAYLHEEQISMREFSERTKYSASQLIKFLKSQKHSCRINESTYKKLRSFLATVKSAETFEPIDIAIEHLEKAKSEILKAQKDINELADFLVKKVGDVVQLRSFLLGRK